MVRALCITLSGDGYVEVRLWKPTAANVPPFELGTHYLNLMVLEYCSVLFLQGFFVVIGFWIRF